MRRHHANRSKAIERAWNIDHLRSAHELLFENIKIMCSEKYKHEVSITIQISGSGNPRTVAHKLSTLAFTIP
ncbi:hypothetical protein K443DRAFT_678868, partial [Laccaria amethystina LaAM-08-1]